MNRTDRLYALVEELRGAAPRARTARQLADRFEVSVRTIERDYVDRTGVRTANRLVEPYGLMGAGQNWYLMGWCRLRGGGRTFRLDRIESARVTEEPAPERSLDEVAGEIAAHLRRTAIEE